MRAISLKFKMLVVLILIFGASCQESDDSIELLGESDSNTVSVMEDMITIDHVKKKSSTYGSFVKALEASGFNSKDFDLDNINKITTANTDVSIISSRFKESDKKIIAYFYEDHYFMFVAEIDCGQLSYRTLSNDVFFTANLDQQEYLVVNSRIEKSPEIQVFSDNVYGCRIEKLKNSSVSVFKSTSNEGYEGCCRKQSSYMECVHCTLDSFHIDKWHMQAALWAFAPEVIAALYASCVGAGTNASC